MRGVRVLEISESVAGAYCTRVLGALGADVAVLEPVGGSALRRQGPWIETPAETRPASALQQHLDFGKRSVVLAEGDAGVRAFERLIRWADIVVSSCDGEPDRAMALNARIADVNPAAVHVVLSGFGLTGPYATWKHSPLIDWASGGHMSLTGEPDREPLNPASPLAACLTGAAAAVGAQAAFLDRTLTGLGQLVDVGAMECGAAGHQWSIIMYTHTGAVKRRWGTLLGEAFHPMALFRCRDGWVCIGAATLQQWEGFCLTLDVPDLLADERLYAPAERFERAAEIDARVRPFLDAHDAGEVVDLLQAARVPASRLLDYTETLASEHLAARGAWADVPGGKVPRAPVTLSRTARREAPAPALGEHTAEVLAEAAADAAARAAFPRIDLSAKRVAEFSIAWAGPLAGRFLADLGLQVTKIEQPLGRGPRTGAEPAAPHAWGALPDPLIRAPVFPRGEPGERRWNRSGLINKLNRGKRSLCLDAKTPGGEAVLARLLASVDVVLHNFSPRGADSLGIDRASIEARRGDAISVAMTGFGETGPLRDFGAYGPLLEAYSGVDQAMGYPGGGPMRIGVAYPDAIGGALGAAATLGAIWEQAAGGGGPVHADLSQLEALLSFAGEAVLAASATGEAPARRGNRSPDHAPHGVYPCAGDDGWVAIAVRTDDEWRALASVVGGELASLSDLPVAARQAQHDRVDAAISAWTAGRTPLEAAKALQAVRVPACPAFTNRDLVESEHLAARGFIVTLAHPDAGPQRFPGFPIHFGRRRVTLNGPPGLGAHNAETLAALGFTADEIAELVRAQVVTDTPPEA